MLREELILLMVKLLQESLDNENTDQGTQASESSPLVGAEAILTSLALVSFITDVESTLAQTYNIELTLVSEQALSRKRSPFLSVETLADYILELVGTPAENRAIAGT
jgi:hypothetical protein